MLRVLLSFLPVSMMVLVIAVVGICLIAGAISLKKAMRWVGCIVLLLIAAPFYDVIFGLLPRWLLLLLSVAAVWQILRLAAEAVLGRAATSHMIGLLAADAVRGSCRFIGVVLVLPFRLARYAWRATR
jgi:hypothetical protein